ncbi:ABC transporter permease subunit [Catenuloplanes japonicus]|uniref:ABC transporter permease subunit n=1 Tax=Catenuloplanes japonicus TaxID=33876 RepID=UPI000523F8E6|nr:ABC transporter permease subunit [Catenuloplanes japonicus]
MIWLTWRQARTQTLIALAALAVLAVALPALGLALREGYRVDLGGCASCVDGATLARFEERFGLLLLLADVLLLAVPALIGLFWGAPLIARELETGTHRLVWSQSITRGHWLAVKLGLLTLLTLAVTGALSLLLTWAASPWDLIMGNRFGALEFASRNVVPLGHAVFAFTLGVTTGLLIRRTVPAMAVTLAIFAVVQVAVPFAVRPHLRSPITESIAFDGASAMKYAEGFSLNREGEVWVEGYALPGAWMLTGTARLMLPDGTAPAKELVEACFERGSPEEGPACLQRLGLRLTVSYQPGERYWTFQWLELAGFLTLAAASAGIAFWRVRRVS